MLDILYLSGVPVGRGMIDGPMLDAQAMFQALMGLVILTQQHVRPKKGFIPTHRGCGITRLGQQATEIYGAISQRFTGSRMNAMTRAMPKAHVEQVEIRAIDFTIRSSEGALMNAQVINEPMRTLRTRSEEGAAHTHIMVQGLMDLCRRRRGRGRRLAGSRPAGFRVRQ